MLGLGFFVTKSTFFNRSFVSLGIDLVLGPVPVK